jgi:hypothetical protein
MKANRKKGIGALLFVLVLGVSVVLVASNFDISGQEGGIADTIPLSLSTVESIEGGALGTVQFAIYKTGMLKETLTTDSDGLKLGTQQYSTGDVLEFLITKSGYVTQYMRWVVPYNSKNLDYWLVPTVEMADMDESQDIQICGTDAVEKSTSDSATWMAQSSNNFKLNGWLKLSISTNKDYFGGEWYLPNTGENYPDQYTYIVLKMNETVEGVNIVRWSRGVDKTTWYKQISPFYRDDDSGVFGVEFLALQIIIPAGTAGFTLTPYIWSDQSPEEMAQSTPEATRLIDITGTVQYLNATATS